MVRSPMPFLIDNVTGMHLFRRDPKFFAYPHRRLPRTVGVGAPDGCKRPSEFRFGPNPTPRTIYG